MHGPDLAAKGVNLANIARHIQPQAWPVAATGERAAYQTSSVDCHNYALGQSARTQPAGKSGSYSRQGGKRAPIGGWPMSAVHKRLFAKWRLVWRRFWRPEERSLNSVKSIGQVIH